VPRMLLISILDMTLGAQPQSKSKAEDLLLISGHFVDNMFNSLAILLWKIWLKMIQLSKVTFNVMVYSNQMWPSAMSAMAYQANATVCKERMTKFDTDSEDIGIDNRCSACILHMESDFEGPLLPCDRVIKGFGGSRTRNVKSGTIRWSWEDDQGHITTFRIPNSYFVPEGNMRLLSPQHWAQTQGKAQQYKQAKNSHKNYPSPHMPLCGETTDDRKCVLYWNQGTHTRSVTLGKADNVATFTMAPGYKKFHAFCCETEMMMKRKMMGPALVTSSGFTSRYVKAGGQLMTARWSAAKRVR